MDKEMIGKLLDDLVGRVAEIRELIGAGILQLEEENFRLGSTGWKQFTNKEGIVYRENLEKDVWEYVGGVPYKLLGQQLFTWPAAMRETEKVGKRMPTDEEWSILTDGGNNRLNLGKVLSGIRHTNGAFNYLDANTYFWSSSVLGANAWKRYLYVSYATVSRGPSDQANGFSVRCLKD